MTETAGHRTVTRGLTGTLRGAYYAAAATGAASAYAVWVEIGRFDAWWQVQSQASLSRLLAAEEGRAAVLAFFSLTVLAVAVLTIVWWYQAYRAVQRLPVTDRSWSAGWAVGGWFLPIANLIVPKLVLNEIDRLSGAADTGLSGWRRRPLLGTARWWWLLWVFGGIPYSFGALVAQVEVTSLSLDGVESFDGEMYRTALWMLLSGLAALGVSALFAAASLRMLGGRLHPDLTG